MFLKRLHDHTDPDNPTVRNVIRILRAGPRQHFSPELVQRATAEGWMSLVQGVLTLHGEDGDVRYRMLRSPGYYCCHCGMALEEAGAWADEGRTTTQGMVHVATAHPKKASPDASNPAGYERITYFDCVRQGEEE